MTQTIDLNETQETIESVLDMLQHGDDILFVRDGQPIARMEATGTVFLSPEPVGDKPFKRIPGLGAGTIWVSDDFDDPLPDEFWLGHPDDPLG